MEIEKVFTCPLGSKCEEIKDNKLHVCKWYTTVRGVHPQTGEEVDDKECAMVWMPILLLENSRTNRSTAAAVESFRNEMVKANDTSMQIVKKTIAQTVAVAAALPQPPKFIGNDDDVDNV